LARAFLVATVAIAITCLARIGTDPHRPPSWYDIGSAGSLVLFTAALALVARGLRLPRRAVVLPALGCGSLVFVLTAADPLPRDVEFGILLLGDLSLVAASLLMAARYWPGSRPGAVLVSAGGILGSLVLLRLSLRWHHPYFDTIGLESRIGGEAQESIVALSSAGLLLLAGSFARMAAKWAIPHPRRAPQ
jgi:hypothetical protein